MKFICDKCGRTVKTHNEDNREVYCKICKSKMTIIKFLDKIKRPLEKVKMSYVGPKQANIGRKFIGNIGTANRLKSFKDNKNKYVRDQTKYQNVRRGWGGIPTDSNGRPDILQMQHEREESGYVHEENSEERRMRLAIIGSMHGHNNNIESVPHTIANKVKKIIRRKIITG